MPAYILFGTPVEYEEAGVGSCWVDRRDQYSYALHAIDGDQITFWRGDGSLLTLERAEAEKVMVPT